MYLCPETQALLNKYKNGFILYKARPLVSYEREAKPAYDPVHDFIKV